MLNSSVNLSLTPLKKAIGSLAEAIDQPFDPFIRDATIQRFEYTFELSWKILQRYLQLQTPNTTINVKDLFRIAARMELIDNPEPWFEYLKARNLTSHTYNEITANETYSVAQRFLPDAIHLLTKLEAAVGDRSI